MAGAGIGNIYNGLKNGEKISFKDIALAVGGAAIAVFSGKTMVSDMRQMLGISNKVDRTIKVGNADISHEPVPSEKKILEAAESGRAARSGNVNHGGRIVGSDDFAPVSAEGISGDGFGILSGRSYTVTREGINRVKKHITSNGFDAYENTEMIGRLENALKNGEKISGADASFYMHELKESALMQGGMSYQDAHEASIKFFGVSRYSVYHPDVISMQPSMWNNSWRQFWNLK